jgi:hypothetical protein
LLLAALALAAATFSFARHLKDRTEE